MNKRQLKKRYDWAARQCGYKNAAAYRAHVDRTLVRYDSPDHKATQEFYASLMGNGLSNGTTISDAAHALLDAQGKLP